jgi:predicted nuclease of restriction endonuclease-like (RecB) superfamily
MAKTVSFLRQNEKLLGDLRSLILEARQDVARRVNSALVMLYWKVGQRIRKDLLNEKRGDYGEKIVPTVSAQLVEEFGNGFSPPNLSRMVRLTEAFPDLEILSTLSKELGWSHFVEILPLKDDLQRDFYVEMCRVERWSVRTLRQKIAGMLYERTALSKKPDKLIRKELSDLRDKDKLTPDLVFRDPYLLNFLGLKDTYGEKDLEAAILREMESFILELGVGFTFVARQKRMGEFSPLGLILCASKSEEQIELLQLGKSGIRVSAYWTELPPRDLLQKKLHEAIVLARARLEQSKQQKLLGE